MKLMSGSTLSQNFLGPSKGPLPISLFRIQNQLPVRPLVRRQSKHHWSLYTLVYRISIGPCTRTQKSPSIFVPIDQRVPW